MIRRRSFFPSWEGTSDVRKEDRRDEENRKRGGGGRRVPEEHEQVLPPTHINRQDRGRRGKDSRSVVNGVGVQNVKTGVVD